MRRQAYFFFATVKMSAAYAKCVEPAYRDLTESKKLHKAFIAVIAIDLVNSEK